MVVNGGRDTLKLDLSHSCYVFAFAPVMTVHEVEGGDIEANSFDDDGKVDDEIDMTCLAPHFRVNSSLRYHCELGLTAALRYRYSSLSLSALRATTH